MKDDLYKTLRSRVWIGDGKLSAVEKIADSLGETKRSDLNYHVDILRKALLAKNIYIKELEDKLEEKMKETKS